MKIYSIQPNYSNSMRIRKNLNEEQTTGLPQPAAPAPTPSFCAIQTSRRGALAALLGGVIASAKAGARGIEDLIPSSESVPKAVAKNAKQALTIRLLKGIDKDAADAIKLKANYEAKTVARMDPDSDFASYLSDLYDRMPDLIERRIESRLEGEYHSKENRADSRLFNSIPTYDILNNVFAMHKQNFNFAKEGKYLKEFCEMFKGKERETQLAMHLRSALLKFYGKSQASIHHEFEVEARLPQGSTMGWLR